MREQCLLASWCYFFLGNNFILNIAVILVTCQRELALPLCSFFLQIKVVFLILCLLNSFQLKITCVGSGNMVWMRRTKFSIAVLLLVAFMTNAIFLQFECSTCSSKTKAYCYEVILSLTPYQWRWNLEVKLECATTAFDLILKVNPDFV